MTALRIPAPTFVGRRWSRRLLLALALVGLAAGVALLALRAPSSPADPVEAQARDFVALALALRTIDEKEVDSYFGPPDLRPRAGPRLSLAELGDRAEALAARVKASTEGDPVRRAQLGRRVAQFAAILRSLESPGALGFADEARQVYATPLGDDRDARAAEAVARLDALLPGPAPLATRVAALRERFVIPPDRRKAVFDRALQECRARTVAHWRLPQGERLHVEWTGDVGAAWHRYEGGFRSTLRLNPLAVAYLGSAVDLACHEGYPGHHAQFVAMEADAAPSGLAIEDRLVLLRSPESVLREGAANYGVDLAFPPAERLAFERDVLLPLAGIPADGIEVYAEVHRMVAERAFSVMPVLRDYSDGRIGPAEAAAALSRDAMVSSPEALLGFVDALGAYAIGYTVARDRVRDHAQGGGEAEGGAWSRLRRIVTNRDAAVLQPRPHAG